MLPMQMRHNLPKARIVDRYSWAAELSRGLRVIHCGFAGQEHRGALHRVLLGSAKDLIGIDVDENAVAEAERAGWKVFLANCQDRAAMRSLNIRADLIVAAEIIEHLDSPGPFLDAMHELGDTLLVTTPNAASMVNAVAALAHRELVNEDHVSWFSWYTLSNILSRHHWDVNEFAVYRYREAGSFLGRLTFGAQNALSYLSPFIGYGLAALSRSS